MIKFQTSNFPGKRYTQKGRSFPLTILHTMTLQQILHNNTSGPRQTHTYYHSTAS